jgi:hypothetical protein
LHARTRATDDDDSFLLPPHRRQARLWKLILSQSPEGWWDATHSVAFALEARALTEVASLKLTWLEALKDRLTDVAELAGDLANGEVSDSMFRSDGHQDVADDATDSSPAGGTTPPPPPHDASSVPQQAATRTRLARLDSMAAAYTAAPAEEEVSDDPLVCSADAVRACMPRRLAALAAAQPEVEVERVWTTLCCVAFLESLSVSWLATDGDLYPAEERTVVDAAREWVEAHAKLHPPLAAALADGALAKVASRTVGLWHRAWDRRVGELRRTHGITDHLSISYLHRSGCELMRAVCTKHETFSVFLSAPLDGLQRWQMWMIVITLVIEQARGQAAELSTTRPCCSLLCSVPAASTHISHRCSSTHPG